MFRKLIFSRQIKTICSEISNGKALNFTQQSIRYSHKKQDEVKSAHQVAEQAKCEETIFSKIIRKEIPADIVFEDEKCLAFRDIQPQAPCHILLIPKVFIPQLCKVEEKHASLMGHLMVVASKIAAQEDLKDGFRIIINDGKHGAQSVYHLHIHIMGRRQMKWPPG